MIRIKTHIPPQMDTGDVVGSYIVYDAGLVKAGPCRVGKAVGFDADGEMVWNYWTELPGDYFDDT